MRRALHWVGPGAVSLLVGVAAALMTSAPAAAAQGQARAGAVPSPPAAARLYLSGAFNVAGQVVTVPDRAVQVVGIVRPYVPGQVVLVRVLLGPKVLKVGRYRLFPSAHQVYATFKLTVRSPGVGVVTVTVDHAATAAMGAFSARRRFTALGEGAGFGSTGRFVELIQQRLAALHFYIPQTGVYDAGTGLALDAYHRLLRWGTYQTLDTRTIAYLLNGWGAFPVHDPGDGRHAEGDLTLQLVALVDGSRVVAIYPISSGKPSTPTILGHFHVYSKVPGYLPDGMYYSNFFYSGYAIHGYDPAPDYPASHGCMRLPIVDAISVYDWLSMGDAVDVYY